MLISVVLCLCLLTGCSSELKGRWVSASDSGVVLIFSSTGKMVMSDGNVELSGTYVVEGNRLTMTLISPLGDSYVIETEFLVEDGKLMLTNEKGFTETFIK